MKKFLSYVLLAAGAFLLMRGARDLLESQWGQREAAQQFDQAASAPSSENDRHEPQLGDTVAKLLIPRLETQLYVVEGVDAQDLRRGPGHMPGTALPGGGGNCVIAAHRDTHFRVLKDIQRGDDIVLQTSSGQFLYRVRKTEIVSPKNTKPIQPTDGAVLNLITCYPFYYVGNAPRRFIVEAQLAAVVGEPQNAGLAQTPAGLGDLP
jgi:sortase A